MRVIKKHLVLLCLVVAALTMKWDAMTACAANHYVTNCAMGVKQTVGKTSFIAKQYKVGNDYRYKIVMKKNGKSKTIAKNTTCAFTTNGKIVYYVARGKKTGDYSYKNTIYKYTIKSGKKSKVVAGTDYTVKGCSGSYIYCGTDLNADGVKLYAINVKTKKKTYMRDCAGGVYVAGKYVIASTNTGAPGNYPIYSYKLNGKGKKKIADGGVLKVEGNKVYYSIVDESCCKFKVYTCSPNGNNKKEITGWLDTVPREYYE